MLLEMGLSKTVDQAEQAVQKIRLEVKVDPLLKQDLQKLYPGS
ncbi:hypothetical protein [Effusibacillus consociatus]|uniref:Uncharacterized protein n=1 Tax=Effusibacillus consociatus TaxID=1117041 RepID=A0ABV9Q011_9BACL